MSSFNALSGLSCYADADQTALHWECFNALSGLYVISTVPLQNLGFMRFPEPAFAGIYQNILTTTIFRAC